MDATVKRRAAALLRQGTPIALETDTVFGLAIIPGCPDARRRLFRMKRRPPEKCLAVLCADMSVARRYVSITPTAKKVLCAYSPGAVTVVLRLRRRQDAAMFGSADGTLGVRFPAHDGCRDIIRKCGGFLHASSANISGNAPALSHSDIRRSFPDVFIAASGLALSGKASAVVDCTTEKPIILRA